MVDEDKKKIEEKDFISYLDDDNTPKNQYAFIVEENDRGVIFKFNKEDSQTIFIPWIRVLKIKKKEVQHGN